MNGLSAEGGTRWVCAWCKGEPHDLAACPVYNATPAAALARPVGGCLHGPGKPDGPDVCPNCGYVTSGVGA